MNFDKNKDKVNREEICGMENPFMRKSVIMRSPPVTGAVKPQVSGGRPDNNVGKKPVSCNVGKLGEGITRLLEFLKTRSNVHKDIVSMSRDIQAVYMQMVDDLENLSVHNGKQVMISKETQTEELTRPGLVQMATPKRKREFITLSPKESKSKRRKKVTPRKMANTDAESGGRTVTPKETGGQQKVADPNWQQVRPRRRNRSVPNRPDALVIKTCGEKSYADILRQVKSDPKLNVLGQNVKSIRKTGKGELLLELSKPCHQNTSEFRGTMREVLGTTAEVRALTHEVIIEIRDIDEVTDKDDVHKALINISEEFKSLQSSAIKSLRKAYGGTQTATIGLSAVLASQLLELAKIRIGWVVCRIREKLTPRRCFKCFDYGHTAARCKGQNDHSGKCLRCGEVGHKIKMCTRKPSCILCRESGSNIVSDHVTGCTVCPYYKKALQKLTLSK